MSRGLRVLVGVAIFALTVIPRPSIAQYMFLDTNGDGANTAADQLNENCVPTVVDVYLWTDSDRLANQTLCPTGGDLSVFSYLVNLRTVGGGATFTNFINQQAADMGINTGLERRSATEWQRGQGGGTPLPPSSVAGVYKLMTITVTGSGGTPTLEIAPITALSANRTSFGTECAGLDGDNTYKLGSDWLDVDGLQAADVDNGKDMPIITVPATLTGLENQPVSITATASDADADLITLSRALVSAPAGSGTYLAGPTTVGPVASPSITLSGTPSFTQSGSTTITWTANDGNACIRTGTSIVAIANSDRGPVVTAPASVNEGSPLSFTVSAIDPDVQTITTFTAAGSAIAAGAAFAVNAGSAAAGRVGTLTWTPTTTQSGSYTVTFTATNALSGLSATVITVNDPNQAPVVTAPPSVVTEEGAIITIEAEATSTGQGGTLELSVQGYPTSLALQIVEGAGATQAILTGQLGASDSGTYIIFWTASEGNSPSATDTTVMEVASVNFAPEIYAPANKNAQEGALLTFTVIAEDPDADPITAFTANLWGLPTGNNAVFTTNAEKTEGTLTWTPTFTDAGNYSVTFTASNFMTGSAVTTIHVANVPVEILRIKMPGPDYRVLVDKWDTETCEVFGYCGRTEYASDDSGYVSVPLGECASGTVCNWFDHVRIEPQYRNFAAFIAPPGSSNNDDVDVIEPILNLHPEDSPEDRIREYTPATDPWRNRLLSSLADVKRFYLSRYGYAPGAVRVYIGAQVFAAYDRGIEVADSVETGEGYTSVDWVLAHEYAHMLQHSIYGGTGAGCCNVGGCGHSLCESQPCGAGPWTEGMADGMADFYTYTTFGYTDIWHRLYCPAGGNVEANVSDYVYVISRARPDAFMNTFRNGLITFTGSSNDHARNLHEFHSLWKNVDPDPGWIVQSAPGPFDDSLILELTINHVQTHTGVEEQASDSPKVVRMLSANPLRRELRLELSLPSGQEGRLHVHDVRGRLVRRAALPRLGIAQVDLGSLAGGVYFIRVLGDRGAILLSRRVVVVR